MENLIHLTYQYISKSLFIRTIRIRVSLCVCVYVCVCFRSEDNNRNLFFYSEFLFTFLFIRFHSLYLHLIYVYRTFLCLSDSGTTERLFKVITPSKTTKSEHRRFDVTCDENLSRNVFRLIY